MATFYIPDENGWASQGVSWGSNYQSQAGAGHLRIQVDQVYDEATNSSTLAFSLWAYSEIYSGNFGFQSGGTLSVNGSVLKTFTQSSVGNDWYFVETKWDNIWRQVKHRDGTGPDSWSVTVPHEADGSLTVTAAVDFKLLYAVGGLTYVMAWNNSANSTAGSVERQFTLTISADGHVNVSVTRNGTSLPSGSTILLGDVLTVTAAATGGYQIQSATINGQAFTSPATVNVTEDVAVLVTSTASGFAYIWPSSAWVPYLIYIWHLNAWTRYRAIIWKNGAWVPYG